MLQVPYSLLQQENVALLAQCAVARKGVLVQSALCQGWLTDVGVAAVLPNPAENARRGTVYLGIVLGNQEFTEHVALPGDRNRLRNYAVISIMNFLRRMLS